MFVFPAHKQFMLHWQVPTINCTVGCSPHASINLGTVTDARCGKTALHLEILGLIKCIEEQCPLPRNKEM